MIATQWTTFKSILLKNEILCKGATRFAKGRVKFPRDLMLKIIE